MCDLVFVSLKKEYQQVGKFGFICLKWLSHTDLHHSEYLEKEVPQPK
jgi:hypothetical protein